MVDGKKVYSWSRPPPEVTSIVDPQVVGEELEKIGKENGGNLFPPDIVDAAKSSGSPLHPMFNWDNDDAARRYRLYQARHVVGSLTFVIVPTKTVPENIRELVKKEGAPAYVSIKHPQPTQNQPRTRTYVPFDVAMSKEETRTEVLQKAIREAEYWQEKYNKYAELSLIFSSIEATKKKLKIKA